MTLEALLYKISEYGISRKIINYSSAGASIYDLNSKSIKDYPVLFASPTGNHSATKDTTTFSITLYYLDRLQEDSSNDIDILSTAIEQLKDIVRGIDTIEGVITVSEDIDITNFVETERMSDRIAGAYTTIDVTTLNAYVCPIE